MCRLYARLAAGPRDGRHFVRGCKSDCLHGSVAGSGDSMSVGSEAAGDGIKEGEETLGLLRRLEPPHPALALPGWLMRVLCSIV
jgi:hypothetical protein